MSDRRKQQVVINHERRALDEEGGYVEQRKVQALCNHGRRESDQVYGFKVPEDLRRQGNTSLHARDGKIETVTRAPAGATRLFFHYVNHRGEQHDYLVEPVQLEFSGVPKVADEPAWRLRCNVVERDGMPRPGQRSFIVAELRNVEELQPGSEFYAGHQRIAIG